MSRRTLNFPGNISTFERMGVVNSMLSICPRPMAYLEYSIAPRATRGGEAGAKAPLKEGVKPSQSGKTSPSANGDKMLPRNSGTEPARRGSRKVTPPPSKKDGADPPAGPDSAEDADRPRSGHNDQSNDEHSKKFSILALSLCGLLPASVVTVIATGIGMHVRTVNNCQIASLKKQLAIAQADSDTQVTYSPPPTPASSKSLTA